MHLSDVLHSTVFITFSHSVMDYWHKREKKLNKGEETPCCCCLPSWFRIIKGVSMVITTAGGTKPIIHHPRKGWIEGSWSFTSHPSWITTTWMTENLQSRAWFSCCLYAFTRPRQSSEIGTKLNYFSSWSGPSGTNLKAPNGPPSVSEPLI